MSQKRINRREFLVKSSAAAAAVSLPVSAWSAISTKAAKPAILGGEPLGKAVNWPQWPLWSGGDEAMVLEAFRSRIWSRSKRVRQFEEEFAEWMGAKYCLATTNGTHALLTSLKGLDIGIGDEVLVNPFTFIASIDVILLAGALPIFVDTDPDTLCIDPAKLEAKITSNTRAILPVHIGGGVADMDQINAVAKKHHLKVVEDACQAHFSEWNHKKAGTLGDAGCFSFQASKNYTCGEGGAILSDDAYFIDWCYSYHNFGRPQGRIQGRGYPILGSKCRMAEYQAAILLSQKQRVLEVDQNRTENGDYLTKRLGELPFIVSRKRLPQVTRMTYYDLFCRYDKTKCADIPRSTVIKALQAEGIDCSGGYRDQNKDDFFEKTLQSKNFQRAYSKEQLDFCRAMNHCPVNDALDKEILRFPGRLFMADRSQVELIVKALTKIYEYRDEISKLDIKPLPDSVN